VNEIGNGGEERERERERERSVDEIARVSSCAKIRKAKK
jgi:hypothetical protein